MLREILNRSLVQVTPDQSIMDIARAMEERDVGAVLVVKHDKPVGIVTDRDIVLRCLARDMNIANCKVEDVMTESVEFCRETDGIFDCIQKMRDAKVRRIPVIDSQGRPVGIISFGDLLGVLSKELTTLTSTTTPAEEVGQLGQLRDAAA